MYIRVFTWRECMYTLKGIGENHFLCKMIRYLPYG